MPEYALFNQMVSFQGSELRFVKLQQFAWRAQEDVSKRFDEWYPKCLSIETVLSSFEDFARDTIQTVVLAPLYEELLKCEIYDISQQRFYSSCLDLDRAQEGLYGVEEIHNRILGRQAEEERYRELRKATRSRWQGGGFGLSGALKGAATAGALNMVSGLGHSVVNAVGNTGSAMAATESKNALFVRAQPQLKEALRGSVLDSTNGFLRFINEKRSGYIRGSFDEEKARALFENAQSVPGKREELLLKSVAYCPWSNSTLEYIFVNYPDERKNLWKLAKDFGVDLSESFNAAIAVLYPEAMRGSEEQALQAKQKILQFMAEYGIEENETLDTLEKDCVGRLCENVENASEQECEAMRQAVNAYDALQKNKQPFLEKLDQRVKDIWKQEDADTFAAIYTATDITDSNAVAEAIERIKSQERTDVANKYVEALQSLEPKQIKKAKEYRLGKKPRTNSIWAIALGISGVIALVMGNVFWLAVAYFAVAVLFACKNGSLKHSWNQLTVDGTAIPPELDVQPIKPKMPKFVFVLLLIAVFFLVTGFSSMVCKEMEQIDAAASSLAMDQPVEGIDPVIAQSMAEEEDSAAASEPVDDAMGAYMPITPEDVPAGVHAVVQYGPAGEITRVDLLNLYTQDGSLYGDWYTYTLSSSEGGYVWEQKYYGKKLSIFSSLIYYGDDATDGIEYLQEGDTVRLWLDGMSLTWMDMPHPGGLSEEDAEGYFAYLYENGGVIVSE